MGYWFDLMLVWTDFFGRHFLLVLVDIFFLILVFGIFLLAVVVVLQGHFLKPLHIICLLPRINIECCFVPNLTRARDINNNTILIWRAA